MEFAVQGIDGLGTENSVQRRRISRYAALIAVAALHLAALWILALEIRFPPPVGTREVELDLLGPDSAGRQSPVPPAPNWKLAAPENVPVPEPVITIEPDESSAGGVTGETIREKLAPRLDPKHVNDRPELPHTMGAVIAALSVKLRILVLPDGSVSDALVVKTSGDHEIDKLAVDRVLSSWRFLPALINKEPVEAWTTVIVRFVPF